MMSIATIREMSREAAERAAQEKMRPFQFWPEDMSRDVIYGGMKKFPVLGTHLPDGWTRGDLEEEMGLGNVAGVYMGDNEGYGAFFVDATGVGMEYEPAITVDRFIAHVANVEGIAAAKGIQIGWGIVETGEAQVKVSFFRKMEN